MNDKDIKLLAERISLKLKDINNFEKDIRKEERKAFADWLEKWNAEWCTLDPDIEELEKEMEAKIKELGSKGK